jgi:hypothetical protein
LCKEGTAPSKEKDFNDEMKYNEAFERSPYCSKGLGDKYDSPPERPSNIVINI